jgi:hypothetical protein
MARSSQEGARVRLKVQDGKKYVLAEDVADLIRAEMMKAAPFSPARQVLWALVRRVEKLCPPIQPAALAAERKQDT